MRARSRATRFRATRVFSCERLNACVLCVGVRRELAAPGTASGSDLGAARTALVDNAARLGSLRGWDVIVVFDAGATTDGPSVVTLEKGLEVVFTGQYQTADAYIERVACERKPLGDGSTFVASDDGMVRLMTSANGARLMRVAQLEMECDAARATVTMRVESHRTANELQRAADAIVALGGTGGAVSDADADGEWDLGAALSRRLTSDESAQRRDRDARRKAALIALLRRFAALDDDKDKALRHELLCELRDAELQIQPSHRKHLDGEKRLLGLFRIIGETWWESHPAFLPESLSP